MLERLPSLKDKIRKLSEAEDITVAAEEVEEQIKVEENKKPRKKKK